MKRDNPSIESHLLPIARFFWPELNEHGIDDLEISSRLADVLGFLYSAPIALVGLGWLIAVTDISPLRDRWQLLFPFLAGVALVQQTRAAWGVDEVASSVPAIQTLASQIGSALHGAELYRMEQELSLAGQIQASFLPERLPEIPGWQVSATLEPARQTAGDFYDVIPLPNGRFGIVVADVVDKGMGAALYMALARTLLRTYALEYHARPDFAMKVTNRRILMDTDVTMFVTVFYGVLDPRTGRLAYCNAGHNPRHLLRAASGGHIERLTKTGIAVGAIPGTSWEQRVIEMAPGDTLVLYSDGVTDAQNERGGFFGEERLQGLIRANAGDPAHRIQRALFQAAQRFSGEVAQFDDMTLVAVVRDT
jgi:hypothetical protein